MLEPMQSKRFIPNDHSAKLEQIQLLRVSTPRAVLGHPLASGLRPAHAITTNLFLRKPCSYQHHQQRVFIQAVNLPNGLDTLA
jgi:hypothetical protein